MAKTSKQFISDLPKIYGTYTGGFLVFNIDKVHVWTQDSLRLWVDGWTRGMGGWVD